MFSKKHILLFTLFLALASCHNLVFDLRSVKYNQASDYWTVDVPCTGGSGKYTW